MENEIYQNTTYVDFNKKTKGRKALDVIAIILTVIISLGGFAISGIMLLFSIQTKPFDVVIDDSEWGPPQFESTLTRVIPTSNEELAALSKDQKIDLVYYLSTLANSNHIGNYTSGYITDAKITTRVSILNMEIPVRVVGNTVRTPNEYFSYEYRLSDAGASFLKYVPGAIFAQRNYQNKNMEYCYSEKTNSCKYNSSTQSVDVNWEEPDNSFDNQQPKKVFSKTQNLPFYITDLNILPETIVDPTIEYVTTNLGNYYELSFDLDVNNPVTGERNIENLRSGLSGANYTSLHETIQIWENGFYKKFISDDEASNGFLSLKMEYKMTFYARENVEEINTFEGCEMVDALKTNYINYDLQQG